MSIWSRLRRLIERLIYGNADVEDGDSDRLEDEIERLRAVCVLAIAEAERTELELREAVEEGRDGALAGLVPELERSRDRARRLIQQYRRREAEVEAQLQALGEVRRIERLNRRREKLAEFISSAEEATGEGCVQQLEDEARAEAIRLDVIERLNRGQAARGPSAGGDLHDRARRLLEEQSMEQTETE
jgi:hypothetical protein